MKYALVTGACGGLGQAAIKRLTSEGWFVYATDIDPDVISLYADGTNASGILMDSTDEDSVREAYDTISRGIEGLDAVVHLAGRLVVGSVAEVEPDVARNVLEVNLMGVYSVNRIFLSLLLKQRGKIVIVTSETGVHTAAPFNGIYSMSKYALEAYADALRRELAFLGIRVIKIRPGAFKTGMTGKMIELFSEAEENSAHFKKNISRGMPYLPKVYSKAHNPAILAGTILKALTAARPRIAYTLKNDILRSFLEYLPVRWADWLIKRVLS